MKKLLAILLQPPIPHVLGLLILSAVIYFGGQALHPWLGWSDTTLLIVIGGVWLLAVLVWVWRRMQANKRARMIEDRLRGQAREHRESLRPDKRSQVEELEKGLDTALGALRASKLGRSALYELPWFVIIGPPGSGKTTLLKESNLSFPDEVHGRGMRGMGGTRNCDWWFTDQAILLDTAGRYTTQDEDRNEWFAFLDMLKKARSKKPINGVLITISITDILQSSPEQLAEHARKVRDRIVELTERLEVVFPVYLMFSKCDLLAGFIETFGSYDQRQRAQVWGVTTPFAGDGGPSLKDRFDAEFDSLLASLGSQRLDRLATTRSLHKKTHIFSFPLQFAAVRDRVRTFLEQLEQSSSFQESSGLRGLYFTSGTQEGQPLDQVLAEMRSASGLTIEEDSTIEEPPAKKAYFIDDLFTDIVFHDKELAHSSAKAERRRALTRKLGAIASVAATVAMVVVLIVAYAGHSNLIETSIRVHAAAADFDPNDQRALDDEATRLAGVGGPFEQLRRLFVRLDDEYDTVGSYLMGQSNALYEERIRPLYVEKLKLALLRPLHARLGKQLGAALEQRKQLSEEERAKALPPLQAKELSDRLAAYRQLGGGPPLQRDWLADEFLKGKDVWAFPEGNAAAAALAHRETFLDRIFGPASKDWRCQSEEYLVVDATRLVNQSDILLIKVKEAIDDSGQAEKQSFREVFTSHPHAKLLDPDSGITRAFVAGARLSDALRVQATTLEGEDVEGALERRKKQAEVAEWTGALTSLRPQRKSILTRAMDDVVKLTDEQNSLYLVIYKEVCDRLKRLGQDVTAGDTEWLVELLGKINKLQEPVAELCDGAPHLDRIVAAAREGRTGPLEGLRKAFRRVKDDISDTVREPDYVSDSIEGAVESALVGLVESLEYALAREVISETDKFYPQGIGATLGGWSTRFPFAPGSSQSVDTGRFDAVLHVGGEFDETLKWILYLDETLDQIGFGEMTVAFREDMELVKRIQLALFPADRKNAGCEIDYILIKRGNATANLFELDDQSVLAKGREEGTLQWRPSFSARIEIQGYQFVQVPVPKTFLDKPGNWGFLRLLADGTPDQRKIRDVEYQSVLWNSFRDPKTRQELVAGDKRAEAKLYFRTEAEPNPLEPGFFHHEFATEVFRARER